MLVIDILFNLLNDYKELFLSTDFIKASIEILALKIMEGECFIVQFGIESQDKCSYCEYFVEFHQTRLLRSFTNHFYKILGSRI